MLQINGQGREEWLREWELLFSQGSLVLSLAKRQRNAKLSGKLIIRSIESFFTQFIVYYYHLHSLRPATIFRHQNLYILYCY